MNQLTMPTSMGVTIADIARTAGAHGTETGGFILGQTNTRDATVLALTGNAGITRLKNLFQISGLALSALFEWADDEGLTVLAQWHSHRRHAFLSPTDLRYGLNVRDFQTTVVPNYQRPPSDPAAWGWWTFNGTNWVVNEPPRSTAQNFRTMTFEEGPIHDH